MTPAERIMRDTCRAQGERIAAHAWGSHGPGVDEDLVEAVIRYELAPKRITMRPR